MPFQLSSGVYNENRAAEVCRVWDAAFGPEFQLTERLWRQNTADDPSFRPSDVILALDERGAIAGWVLAKQFREGARYTGESLERYANLGTISALVVQPAQQGKGLGRKLLAAGEEQLGAAGAAKITAGAGFRHFLPGVPIQCQAARRLFETAGYKQTTIEVDLDGPLDPQMFEPALAFAGANGAAYRQARPGEETAVLNFLAQTFPGRWHYDMRLYLEQGGDIGDVTVLLHGDGNIGGFLLTFWAGSKVIGPSAYWLAQEPTWGGIGPLGISPLARGKGSGLGLVAAGMQHLYGKGARQARIDWTTLVDFYGKLGFRPTITYWRAEKILG